MYIVDERNYKNLKMGIDSKGVEILVGRQGLLELSKRNDVSVMMNGLVGAAGMEPTLNALEAGVDVVLQIKKVS